MTSRDMTHGVRCSHGDNFECFDDLKAENERLRALLNSLKLETVHFITSGIHQSHLDAAIKAADAALAATEGGSK